MENKLIFTKVFSKELFEHYIISHEIMYREIMLEEFKINIQALENYLGREPTSEDAKNVALIYQQSVFNKYIISYKGHHIGIIERDTQLLKYTITFTPFRTSSFPEGTHDSTSHGEGYPNTRLTDNNSIQEQP